MIATMSTVWDRTAEFLSDNLAALTPIVLLGIFVPLTLLGNLMPLMGSSGQIGDWSLGAIVFVLARWLRPGAVSRSPRSPLIRLPAAAARSPPPIAGSRRSSDLRAAGRAVGGKDLSPAG